MTELYDSSPYLIIYQEIDMGTSIKHKLLKNKTLIYAEKIDEFKYKIPEKAIEIANAHRAEYKPCFYIHEGGGSMTHTGYAAIICGLSGKRLRPCRVESRGHLANGIHARFSIPITCIYISCNSDYIIEIIKVSASLSDNIIEMSQDLIWTGQYDCLPNKYRQYSSAVEAVVDKRNCYHCRSPHYISK